MIRRYATMIDSTAASPLVEKPGPGLAPTAWRIWAAGENVADDGSIFFTPSSAKLLIDEQTARARRYSIDFDHLSILPDRPATAGRASGWHSVAVRSDAGGQPEFWAVDVEWCADAKAGLEADPPMWRYFSPAFETNKAGEVISYVNMALCINPLTHGLPALAAVAAQPTETRSKESRTMAMKPSECAAKLRAMAEATDDDQAKAALGMAAASFDDPADKPADDTSKAAEGDDKPKDEKKPDADAKKAAESDEKPKGDEEKKEAKHAAMAQAAMALATDSVAMKSRLDRLEVKELLEDRTDLTEATRKWCLTQPRGVVESFLKGVSKQHAARSDKPAQGEGAGKTPGLQGEELEQMNRGMGLHTVGYKKPERREDGTFVLHTVRPSDLRTAIQKGQA